MLPTLREVLQLPAVAAAHPTVRAAAEQLDGSVRWVHVSEVTDIADLLEGGELILTTGIALPRSAREVRRYVRDLAAVGAAGLAVELGRRYRDALPALLVEAAADVRLPLVELRTVTPFVAITQAVHTLILDARMRELLASDERQTHRTLLTVLALSPELPPHAAERSAALGVPLAGRSLTGVVVRSVDDTAAPALLRDLANAAADTLRAANVPALVGPLDDSRIAGLLSAPDADARPGAGSRVEAALATVARDLHEVASRRHGVDVVIGVGSTLRGIDQAHATLREAMQVGDTATGLTAGSGVFRASNLRLHGLAYALREDAHVAEYVRRELGPVLALDGGGGLYDVLAEYCRAGGNKTAAAGRLYISRPALYDRVRKLEGLLGVDLDDPQIVLALHFAVLVCEAAQRPDLAVQPGPAVRT